jgi:hypothetical protein
MLNVIGLNVVAPSPRTVASQEFNSFFVVLDRFSSKIERTCLLCYKA